MSDSDCIFCKIAAGDLNATKVYEDNLVVAFADINPVASTHVLIIPRAHISGPAAVSDDDRETIGHIVRVSSEIAKQQGIESYRLVANEGADAGQSVFHLHFHLLGGEPLGWPPFPRS